MNNHLKMSGTFGRSFVGKLCSGASQRYSLEHHSKRQEAMYVDYVCSLTLLAIRTS